MIATTTDAVLDPIVAEVAERLRVAEQERSPIAPVRASLPDDDLASAYAVQAANVDAAVRGGRRVVGRKIGLTSSAVQQQLGVDQPDFGALFADRCWSDSEPIPSDLFLAPRAEAEVAVVLGADLDMTVPTIVDVLRAVDFVLPAIEIVDSRIANWDISIVDTIADNASCGAVVLGTRPTSIERFDHRLCGMVLEVDGIEASLGVGAACLGSPLSAVLWLARRMVEVGTPLLGGDLVLSGALGPMVPIEAGEVIEVRIDGLGSVRAVLDGAS